MNNRFLQAKIINFDIIRHEFQSNKLQNPKRFHKRINKNHFENYESDVKTLTVASSIRSKRQNVNIEWVVMEDFFASNGFV